jgi:ubiquinone/menaquinone biosynthesis C-methylase UbiE
MRLVALDSAEAALAQARATATAFGVSVEGVEGDALSLPFGSDRFDLVLSGGLLEHFDEPRAVLSEMIRVLKPGGTLYADVVPRKVSWYRKGEMARMLRSPWLAPGVLESSFMAPEYVRWLEELGCKEIEVVSCGVYPSLVARLPGALRRAAANVFGKLDGTLLADLVGWYFMISAVKAAR